MCIIWKKQVIEHDLLPIYKSKRIKNKQDHNDTFLNSIVDFLWEGIVSYSIRSLNESLIDHNIEIIRTESSYFTKHYIHKFRFSWRFS